jgi:predicted site-specific integrase-resolvase
VNSSEQLFKTMIVSRGKSYDTIAEAAKQFGVAPKTVHDWIKRGVIPRPPTVYYGIRRVQTFSAQYMKAAKKRIQERHLAMAK